MRGKPCSHPLSPEQEDAQDRDTVQEQIDQQRTVAEKDLLRAPSPRLAIDEVQVAEDPEKHERDRESEPRR